LVLFLQIIFYNFLTIYGITTKFSIRMRPYPAFQCIKFQGNWIMRLCFITTFTPWWKEEGKKKKKKKRKKKWRNLANFWRFISRKRPVRFSWNLKCEVMTLASISTAKIVLFRWSVMELRIHENCVFVLPVNNSRMWCTGFLGHTTHYRVSWWLKYNIVAQPFYYWWNHAYCIKTMVYTARPSSSETQPII